MAPNVLLTKVEKQLKSAWWFSQSSVGRLFHTVVPAGFPSPQIYMRSLNRLRCWDLTRSFAAANTGQDQQSVANRIEIADACLHTKDPAEALKLLASVLGESGPARADFLASIAQSTFKQRQAACDLALRAFAKEPANRDYALRALRTAVSFPGDEYVTKAIAAGESLLVRKPNAELLRHLTKLYNSLPTREQARERLESLSQAFPQRSRVQRSVAQAYYSAGMLDEGIDLLSRLPTSKMRNKRNLYLYVGMLIQKSRLDEAVGVMLEKVPKRARDSIFYGRMGHIFAWSGDIERAKRFLRRAIVEDQFNTGARADLALCFELEGDVATAVMLMKWTLAQMAVKDTSSSVAWEQMHFKRLRRRLIFASHMVGEVSQARFLAIEGQQDSKIDLPFKFREWREGTVDGQHVVALTELGIGDEIRYTSILAKFLGKAASAKVTCDPRMYTLLQRSFPDFVFFPTQRVFPRLKKDRTDERKFAVSPRMRGIVNDAILEAGRNADVWARLVNVFELDAIDLGAKHQSPDTAVLVPDPKLRSHYEKLLAEKSSGRRCVGLSWRGGHRSYNRDSHYFHIEDWAALLERENYSFINLQYAVEYAELQYLREKLGNRFIDIPELDLMNDMEGVAALTASLDATVAICTSVLELSCAVGTPTLYMMRSPQVTHSIRLGAGPGENSVYDDKVWANCKILPRYKMTDAEMVIYAVGHLNELAAKKKHESHE